MADRRGEMQASPRNALMGYLADALGGINSYAQRKDPRMPGGLANPVAGLLSNALSVPALATTADRMSYGAPLTNARQANVPWLKPETADALMMAPVSPRNALAAASLGMGMADNGAMRAATVWHGTPHKFDKFDASKIGTGEGAQAYGHGLYLAESKDVAGSYARNLSNVGADGYANAHMNAQNQVQRFGNDAEWAVEAMTDALGRADDYQKPAIKATIEMIQSGAYKKPLTNAGNLYKVDLPDDQIAKMLDWDKPLSQQPANVQQALGPKVVQRDGGWFVDSGGKRGSWRFTSQAEAASEARQAGMSKDLTGNALHDSVKTGADADTAQMLRQLGIPGIRYLDGGSRGAGQGSSNFVVFPGNEGLLSILERNGQPLK